MTWLGKMAFIMSAIISTTSLNYRWLALGLLCLAIDIVVWIWKEPSYDASGPGKRKNKGFEPSDHFKYYHLHDKNNDK